MPAYATIARPYAKAAFEYALENHVLVEWNLFLQQASMVVSDKRVQALLQNPQFDIKTKLNFIADLCGCTNADKDQAKSNLLSVLAEYRRLLVITDIAIEFNALVKQHSNSVDVTVTSAFSFSAEQQKKLQKALEIRLGKQVMLEVSEDKSLIGGAVIRAGDFVIDGSVQGKLKRLRKAVVN